MIHFVQDTSLTCNSILQSCASTKTQSSATTTASRKQEQSRSPTSRLARSQSAKAAVRWQRSTKQHHRPLQQHQARCERIRLILLDQPPPSSPKPPTSDLPEMASLHQLPHSPETLQQWLNHLFLDPSPNSRPPRSLLMAHPSNSPPPRLVDLHD